MHMLCSFHPFELFDSLPWLKPVRKENFSWVSFSASPQSILPLYPPPTYHDTSHFSSTREMVTKVWVQQPRNQHLIYYFLQLILTIGTINHLIRSISPPPLDNAEAHAWWHIFIWTGINNDLDKTKQYCVAEILNILIVNFVEQISTIHSPLILQGFTNTRTWPWSYNANRKVTWGGLLENLEPFRLSCSL